MDQLYEMEKKTRRAVYRSQHLPGNVMGVHVRLDKYGDCCGINMIGS